jgi:LysR family positive regulator for ilvC
MDIRDLRLFKHLSHSLHFGRTSQACNISPSGLTRTIQRLEDQLGYTLFYRNQRSVSLTGAGRIFSRYCDNILQQWSSLHNELRGDNLLCGELKLYCSVTAILSILPALVERFNNIHPRINIHLQTGDAAMALEHLGNEDTDISIAALPDKLPEYIEFIKLLETPLIFIAPRNRQDIIVYNGGVIDWQQTPLVLAEKGLSRKRVDLWFRQHKYIPNVYSQVAGNEAIIALVSMGCGIGIVPELVLEKSPLKDSVSIVNNTPQLKPFTVGVCTTRKNMHNPIVQAFWRNVKQGAISPQS